MRSCRLCVPPMIIVETVRCTVSTYEYKYKCPTNMFGMQLYKRRPWFLGVVMASSFFPIAYRFLPGWEARGRPSCPMYDYGHSNFTHVYTRKRCILRSLLHAIDFPTCYTRKFFDTLWLKTRLTGALWAKRRERRILLEARDKGGKKNFSSPRLAIRARLALRAKCRVRLAWLIKRLLCRRDAHYLILSWDSVPFSFNSVMLTF